MTAPTRQRIIKVAHDLFYRDGFHSVGLDRILREVGVTKTTFYNHFESKDDLILAALRWHDEWWRDTFLRMLRERGGDRPRDQLLAVFDALDELFCNDEYNGCIFVNVAVEFPAPHDPAHQLAAQHKQAMEDIIRELAAYAGADDPPAFAAEFTLLMEGAYVTQQVDRSPQKTAAAQRVAQMLVAKHVPD